MSLWWRWWLEKVGWGMRRWGLQRFRLNHSVIRCGMSLWWRWWLGKVEWGLRRIGPGSWRGGGVPGCYAHRGAKGSWRCHRRWTGRDNGCVHLCAKVIFTDDGGFYKLFLILFAWYARHAQNPIHKTRPTFANFNDLAVPYLTPYNELGNAYFTQKWLFRPRGLHRCPK